MKRFKNEITQLPLADNNVDGGRALWETGDSHQRYCFGFTIQPETATATFGDSDSLLDANGPFGIVLATSQVFSQGNQEVRGSDVGMDLANFRVRGNTNVTLLSEVPDQ